VVSGRQRLLSDTCRFEDQCAVFWQTGSGGRFGQGSRSSDLRRYVVNRDRRCENSSAGPESECIAFSTFFQLESLKPTL
jgi:hypothetical protein